MISTHVLDIANGGPAVGVSVILEVRGPGSDIDWRPVGRGVTDAQGRISTLVEGRTLDPGTYALTFDVGTYQRERGVSAPFFPEATLVSTITCRS
jgi:5-hydroxyisourate hydrolase